MSVNDDPNEFMKNPVYLKHKEFGDFTAFYATITVCTIFGFAVFLLNIFFCWCSKHKDYWQDSNTGEMYCFSYSIVQKPVDAACANFYLKIIKLAVKRILLFSPGRD